MSLSTVDSLCVCAIVCVRKCSCYVCGIYGERARVCVVYMMYVVYMECVRFVCVCMFMCGVWYVWCAHVYMYACKCAVASEQVCMWCMCKCACEMCVWCVCVHVVYVQVCMWYDVWYVCMCGVHVVYVQVCMWYDVCVCGVHVMCVCMCGVHVMCVCVSLKWSAGSQTWRVSINAPVQPNWCQLALAVPWQRLQKPDSINKPYFYSACKQDICLIPVFWLLTVLTICTSCQNSETSQFCPHGVFLCFTQFSPQTAVTSLKNMNQLSSLMTYRPY